MSLTALRSPRVNQESLLLASFLGWQSGLFFRQALGFGLRPPSRSRRPSVARTAPRGKRHHEDEAAEAVGIVDVRVLDAEPARLEVGEHRLDAPAVRIVEDREVAGLGRHGDVRRTQVQP